MKPTPQTHKIREDLVFAKPGDIYAKDAVVEDLLTGALSGMYGGQTRAELEAEGYAVQNVEDVVAASERHYSEPPKEITQEEYLSALEVLPPGDWQGVGGHLESFYCTEFISGRVTRQYVRIGKKFYSYAGKAEPHVGRAKRVLKHLEESGE